MLKSYVVSVGIKAYPLIEFIRFDGDGVVVKSPSKYLDEIRSVLQDGLFIISSGDDYCTLLFHGLGWEIGPNSILYL